MKKVHILRCARWRGFLMFVVLGLTAPVVQAQVYRWVDEQGVVHFGDRAPHQARVERLALEPPPSQPRRNSRHAYDPERLRENEQRYRQAVAAERRARQRHQAQVEHGDVFPSPN